MKAARRAGWRRRDLLWERLQERAADALEAGELGRARRLWMAAHGLARIGFARSDPRRAASLANAGLAARLAGREALARARYAAAREAWARAGDVIATMGFARRARSSLFHLRMEARHWETYQANMRTRLARIADETAESLAALAENAPAPHRHVARWRGEKPPVFDDARKFLAAALLIAERR